MYNYCFDTVVLAGLKSNLGGNHGDTAIVYGYHEIGDGGGGVFYWDANGDPVEDNGGTIIAPDLPSIGVWRRIVTGSINVRWFGARPNNKNLIPVSNQVGNQLPNPITTQTECGQAIQNAIDYVHNEGGGQVFIPNGIWWIYSYIVIKPNVEVVGSGSGTILKSMDDAPNEHGYGILQCGPYLEKLLPKHSRLHMTVRDLVLDGNTFERGDPIDQFQAYNLAVYDSEYYNEPNFLYSTDIRISNVTSLNSPIDCISIHLYHTTKRDRISVTDCYFSDGYRMAATVASATNAQFSNCDFNNGGVPHGGHSPKACLDLEPNDNRLINKNISFVGCRFRNGVNQILTSSNSRAQFHNCTFITGENTSNELAFNIRTSDIKITSSTFKGVEGSHSRDYYLRQESEPTKGIEPFDNPANNRLELIDCEFEGVGLELQGHQAFITDCLFSNSIRAVRYFPALGVMKGCILQNMGWGSDNGGAFAALVTHNDKTKEDINILQENKHITFLDILVRVNSLIKPDNFETPEKHYGVLFHVDNPYTIHLINIRAEGYYTLGSNENSYRDWHKPNWPPPDSTGDDGAIVRGCTHGGQAFVQEEAR